MRYLSIQEISKVSIFIYYCSTNNGLPKLSLTISNGQFSISFTGQFQQALLHKYFNNVLVVINDSFLTKSLNETFNLENVVSVSFAYVLTNMLIDKDVVHLILSHLRENKFATGIWRYVNGKFIPRS